MRPQVGFIYNILNKKHSVFGTSLFSHIAEIFEAEGVKCHLIPIVNGRSSDLLQRSKQIYEKLGKIRQEMHLVAYSIAGIDTRLAVDSFKIPIKSLTTISSPLNQFALGDYSNTRYSKTYEIEPIAQYCGLHLNMFQELTSKTIQDAQSFSQEIPFFSFTAWRDQMHPMFDKTREILKEWYKDSDKFNDGVVAVREAIAGEHLLSMEADHRDLICPTVDNPNIVIYRLISDNVKQLG